MDHEGDQNGPRGNAARDCLLNAQRGTALKTPAVKLRGRPQHVNVFTDKEELAQRTLNHLDTEHMTVRTIQKHRYSLKI